MTTLTTFDLRTRLSSKLNVSMESEEELDLPVDDILIDSELTVDGEFDDLNEDVNMASDADTNLDIVDEATTTLESLILSMESSILSGGFDKTNAHLANITLESISTRFGLQANQLSFGMEEIEEDGEAETKSAMSKAKDMLGALKANAGALLSKLYTSAAAVLGNVTAISTKMIVAAQQLKAKLNADNKGGESLPIKKSVKRKLTVDGNTALAPDQYVKELNRLVGKYNTVVKAYSDNDILSRFVSDVSAGVNGKDGANASKEAIKKAVRDIKDGITLKSKTDEDTLISEPYLGGARITAKRATLKQVQELVNELTTPPPAETVSQEDVKSKALGAGKFLLGCAAFAVEGVMYSKGVGLVVTALFDESLTKRALSKKAGMGVLLCLISVYGVGKALTLVKEGAVNSADAIRDLYSKARAKLTKDVEEGAEIGTEFAISGGDTTSMESEEDANVQSLSGKQVGQVLDLIITTSATTQTIKKELAKRKSLMGEIDKITKQLAADNNGEGNDVSAATATSSAFIKQFLKQTIKFEMDMTRYSLGILKAALTYANLSNGSVAKEEPAEEAQA